MNAIDEILKIAGNDTCTEVGARIGVSGRTIASVLNLTRLKNEEQMVEAAPAVNCYNLARLPHEQQEALEDDALVLEPRRFEALCKVPLKGLIA